MEISGQWMDLNTVNAEPASPLIILNIDDMDDGNYAVTVAVIGQHSNACAWCTSQILEPVNEMLTANGSQVYYYSKENGVLISLDKAKSICNIADLSTMCNLSLRKIGDHVVLNIEIGGVSIERTLVHIPLPMTSELAANVITWHEFKERFYTSPTRNLIFRGQQEPWPLTSTFHRRGRTNIWRYGQVDLTDLHQAISAVTGRYYEFSNALQHAALMYLGQHYGFPSPLIDWTKSPFIAAYFAFEKISKAVDQHKHARILVFDVGQWNKFNGRAGDINVPYLTLTMLRPLAMGNERMMPQQSVCMFTNIVDVERYISFRDELNHTQCLTSVDIPHSERNMIMRELMNMGISAASLFPGVEGVCRMLSENNF